MTPGAPRPGARLTLADAARELVRHDASLPTTAPRNLHRLVLGHGRRTATLLAAAKAGESAVTIAGKVVYLRDRGDFVSYWTDPAKHDEFVGIVGNVLRQRRGRGGNLVLARAPAQPSGNAIFTCLIIRLWWRKTEE